MPTRNDGNDPSYRIFSFGSRAAMFSSCSRLHASLLGEAIQMLDNQGSVVVRVGVGPEAAIIVKDGDGTIRSSVKRANRIVPSRFNCTNNYARFSREAARILSADKNTASGKISTPQSKFYDSPV